MERLRFPLMGMAFLALLGALWAGLVRAGFPWPVFQPALAAAHGPLLVSGFLGTLIGLERAVAFSYGQTRRLLRLLPYLPPFLSGAGGFILLVGLPRWLGMGLIAAGSLAFGLVMTAAARKHPYRDAITLAVGAWLWAAGNLLWLSGRLVHEVVLWWMGFFLLTILGERLEPIRMPRWTPVTRFAFAASLGAFLLGLVISLFSAGTGLRVSGLGLVLAAGWMLAFDHSRRAIRQGGLPRFVGAALLLGFLWLGVSGLLAVFLGNVAGGLLYDALLHAFLVGFVFSMIFGHAPIIFPAIFGTPIAYHRWFYAHLALLHSSLVVRIVGDFLAYPELRRWGGLLNAAAILLFLAVMILSILRFPKRTSMAGQPVV
jgi:hypothetical protein